MEAKLREDVRCFRLAVQETHPTVKDFVRRHWFQTAVGTFVMLIVEKGSEADFEVFRQFWKEAWLGFGTSKIIEDANRLAREREIRWRSSRE